jgi:hypothetical protein
MVSSLKKLLSANLVANSDLCKVAQNATTSRNGPKVVRKLISDKSDTTVSHSPVSHILFTGRNGRENSSGIWTVLSPVIPMANRDSSSQDYTSTS